MKIGMLWFDNDPKKPLADKVGEASRYYLDKYKSAANCCYVHPSMLPEDDVTVDGISVKTNKVVLPGHLWMGKARYGVE